MIVQFRPCINVLTRCCNPTEGVVYIQAPSSQSIMGVHSTGLPLLHPSDGAHVRLCRQLHALHAQRIRKGPICWQFGRLAWAPCRCCVYRQPRPNIPRYAPAVISMFLYINFRIPIPIPWPQIPGLSPAGWQQNYLEGSLQGVDQRIIPPRPHPACL